MTNNLEKEISDKYVVSGTLGDMFSVFCKLYGLRKDGFGNKIRLKYFTTHPEFYPLIEKLFSNIDDVSIEKPITCSSAEDNIAQLVFSIKNDNLPYIGVNHNGKEDGIGYPDPDYMKMDPFPEINIKLQNVDRKKFNIGIQLQTGKIGGNFKGFSLRWISRLRKHLQRDKYDFYLLGTGQGYSSAKIEHLCSHHNIVNKIGKTSFEEWLSYIKSMNFYITPEGFSAFFAMSQRVRTLVFYRDYQIVKRIHPLWKRENIILSAGEEGIGSRIINRICRDTINRNHLLSPINPSQVYSIIWSDVN